MLTKNDHSKLKISVIIPSYNEERNIVVLYKRLHKVFLKLKKYNKEFIFVDDGSSDNTLKEIIKLSKIDKTVKYVSFSRNFGHQCALKAGLDYAGGDCVISMDADLQHPPELIKNLLFWWSKGYEVVYTVRNDKETSFFKKITSLLFYKLINSLSDLNIEYGAADFRLLDRKVVNSIISLKDSAIFLRGLISWVGFRQKSIDYSPGKRFSGKTKYSFLKMFRFAINGIISFSIKPLQVSTWIGLILSVFSFLYLIYTLVVYVFNLGVISGWTSLIVSILFLGGIQLLMLGIIGEYLGKLYIETKGRPAYIISETNL